MGRDVAELRETSLQNDTNRLRHVQPYGTPYLSRTAVNFHSDWMTTELPATGLHAEDGGTRDSYTHSATWSRRRKFRIVTGTVSYRL